MINRSFHSLINDIMQMNETLKHRGRDDQGFWVKDKIALSHNRLAILDKTNSSKQPMISRDGNHILIYNGELYNYKELKAELEKKGKIFSSSGDTEVILEALIEWGINAINKFNGMFAFAFYNAKENKLYLSRDRYGIKPLYFCASNNSLVFASEEKAFKKLSFIKQELDLEAVIEYFTFQNIFSEKTFYKGIETLPPGCFMEVQIENRGINYKMVQYWDFEFRENAHISNQFEIQEEVERLINQAVCRNLQSDVEVGQYLSGGIDTGLIASIAAKRIHKMKSFTVGFDTNNVSGLELGFDERAAAHGLANSLGMDYSEYVVRPGDMEAVLRELTWAIDTPRVGQSYPNFFAAKMASEKVKVVLSGTGSDELFAGYPWRYFVGRNFTNFDEYAKSYYNYWQRLIKDDEKPNFFKPIWGNAGNIDTYEIFRNRLIKHGNLYMEKSNTINNSLYFEAKTFLPGLLNIEDKIHMHFGIENRVPFLDNDLVDFITKIPVKYKILNGLSHERIDENVFGDKKRIGSTSESGKFILQRIYRKNLPGYGGWNKKQGFSAPDESWFKGANSSFVQKELLNPKIQLFNFLNYSAVEKILENHFSGKKNMRLMILSLLTFKSWIDQNL